MKILSITSILLACLFLNIPQHVHAQNDPEEQVKDITMKIEGMMCGFCERNLKGQMENLESIEDVEVSY